ncbi:UNVERIFIED_CONTAM: eIF2 kinase IF2K-D (incomplete catalytic triad) [Hammondia hammondi]|eukprot:XP_008885198.1 eIF2 kinase IF2K-D (incomplete catalytic triad) [Hammondia hammondi]
MRIGTETPRGGPRAVSEEDGDDGSWTVVASKRRRPPPRTPRGSGPASQARSARGRAAASLPDRARRSLPQRSRRPRQEARPHGSPPCALRASAAAGSTETVGTSGEDRGTGLGEGAQEHGTAREVREQWPELAVAAQGGWGESAPPRATSSWATVAAGSCGPARAPPGQALRPCLSRSAGRETPRGDVPGQAPRDVAGPRSPWAKTSASAASSRGQEMTREGPTRPQPTPGPAASATASGADLGRSSKGQCEGETEGIRRSSGQEGKATGGKAEGEEGTRMPQPDGGAGGKAKHRGSPEEGREKAGGLVETKGDDAEAKRGPSKKDYTGKIANEARVREESKGTQGGKQDRQAGRKLSGEKKRDETSRTEPAGGAGLKSTAGIRQKVPSSHGTSPDEALKPRRAFSSSALASPSLSSMSQTGQAAHSPVPASGRGAASARPPVEAPTSVSAPQPKLVSDKELRATSEDTEKALSARTPRAAGGRAPEREVDAGRAERGACGLSAGGEAENVSSDEQRDEGAEALRKGGKKADVKTNVRGKEAKRPDGGGAEGSGKTQEKRERSAQTPTERPGKVRETQGEEGEVGTLSGGRKEAEGEALASFTEEEKDNQSQETPAAGLRFICQCEQGDSVTEEQEEDEVRAMDAMYTPVKILQPGFLSAAFLAELHDPLLDFCPPSPHAPALPDDHRGGAETAVPTNDLVLTLPVDFLSGKRQPVSPVLTRRLSRAGLAGQCAPHPKAVTPEVFNLRACPWLLTLSVSGCGFCALSGEASEEEETEETDANGEKEEPRNRASPSRSSPEPSQSPRPGPHKAAGASPPTRPAASATLDKEQTRASWTDPNPAREPFSHSSLSTSADIFSLDAHVSSGRLSPSATLTPSGPASAPGRSPVSSPSPDGTAAQETGDAGAKAEAALTQRCQLCSGECDVECVRYLFRVLSETQRAFFAVVDVLLPRNYPAGPPYVAVGLSHAVPRKEVQRLLRDLREEFEASKGEVVLYRLCLQLQSFMAELSSTSCFSNLWEEMHFKERQRRHLLLREQHMIHQSLKARQGLLSHAFGPSAGFLNDERRASPLGSSESRHTYGYASTPSLADSVDDSGLDGSRAPGGGPCQADRGAQGSFAHLATAAGADPLARAGSSRGELERGLGDSGSGPANGGQFAGRLAALERFGEQRGENAFTFQAAVKARMRRILDDRREEPFDKEPSLQYSRSVAWAADDEASFYWEDDDDEDVSDFLDLEEDYVDIQSSFYASPSHSRRRASHRHWMSQFRRCRSAATSQPSPISGAFGLDVEPPKKSEGAPSPARDSEAPATSQAPPGVASGARAALVVGAAPDKKGGGDSEPGVLEKESPPAPSDQAGFSSSPFAGKTPEAKKQSHNDVGTQAGSGALGSIGARDGAAAGDAETATPASGVSESLGVAGAAGLEERRRGAGSFRSLLLSSQRTTRYQRDFIQLEVLSSRERYRIALVYHIVDKHKYIVKQIFIPCGPAPLLTRLSPGTEAGRRRKHLQGLELVESALRQVTLLCALQHPYIIRYHQAWTQYHTAAALAASSCEGGDPSNAMPRSDLANAPESGEEPCIGVYVQMEFCERSLEDEIEKRTVLHWDSQQIWTLFRQTLEALVYIHRNRVCHLSLKPSNVFLEPDAYGYNVKLGDFGVTSLFSIVHNAHSPISRLYTAPELLGAADRKLASLTMRDADKADMYSLGVLFAEMWGRHEMFGRSCSRIEFLTSLVKERNLQQLNVPSAAVKIIKHLLSPNPGDRPSSMTLLQSSLLPPAVEEDLFKAFLLRLRTQVQSRSATPPLRDSSLSPASRKKTDPRKKNLDKSRNALASTSQTEGVQSHAPHGALGLAGEVLKIFFRRQFDSASATLFFSDFLRRSSTAPEPEMRCLVQRTLAEFFARCGADEIQIPLLVPLTKDLAKCEEALKHSPTHASIPLSESLSLLDHRNVLLTLPRFFTSALCACGDVGALPDSLHSASLAPSPEAALQALLSPVSSRLSTCPFCGELSPSATVSPRSSFSSTSCFAHAALLSAPVGRAYAGLLEDSEGRGKEKTEDSEISSAGGEYRRFCVGHCYTAPTVSFLASYGHPLPYFSACYQLLFPAGPEVPYPPSTSPPCRKSSKPASATAEASTSSLPSSSSPCSSSSRLALSAEEQRTALLEAEVLSVCGGALRTVQASLGLPLGWRVSWSLGSLMPAILREFFLVPLSDLPHAMALLRQVRPSEAGQVPRDAIQKAVEKLLENHSVLPLAERPRFAASLLRVAACDGASVRASVARLFRVHSGLHRRMQSDAILSKLCLLLTHRPLAPRPLLLQLLSSSSLALGGAGQPGGDRGRDAERRVETGPSQGTEGRGAGDSAAEESLADAFLAGEVGRHLMRALYIERSLAKTEEECRNFLFRVFLPGDFRSFDPMGLLFQASVGTSCPDNSSSSSSFSSSSPFEGIPVGDGGNLLAWPWSGEEPRGGRVCRQASSVSIPSLSALSHRSGSVSMRRREEKLFYSPAVSPAARHTLSFELALERVLSFSSLLRRLRENPALCQFGAGPVPLPSFVLPLGFSAEANAAALRLATALVKQAARPTDETESFFRAGGDGANSASEIGDDAALVALPQVVVTVQSAKQLPLGFSLVCRLLRRGIRAELRVTPVVETSYFQRLLRRSRRILYHVQIQHHRASVAAHATLTSFPESCVSALASSASSASLLALDVPPAAPAFLPGAPTSSGVLSNREAAASLLRGEHSVQGGFAGAFQGREEACPPSSATQSSAAAMGIGGPAGPGAGTFAGPPHSLLLPAAGGVQSLRTATGAACLPSLASLPAAYVIEALHAGAGGARDLASTFFPERKKQKVFTEGAAIHLLCSALVEGYEGEKGSGGRKSKKGGAAERGDSDCAKQSRGGRERR